jgi:uncharacterized SAM-binding protein YcdF (DUF218 family)
MPLTWVIGCFIAYLIVKKKKLKRAFFITGISLLIIFSNQYISNRVMLWWEPQPIDIPSLPNYDVGIVFTGVTKGDKRPNDRVYFEKGADRITHTLQLYNAGKLKHILISGGLGFQQYTQSYAAERLKSFLLMAGVPDSVITVEADAANTYENAVNSAQILKDNFQNQRYILITSAFHMKRSKLCLNKQGVAFDTFPTDYYTGRSTFNFDDLFIPKAESIQRWQLISREIAGIITYKLMGYI